MSDKDDLDLDLLGEVGNMSVGGAASALSNFLRAEVSITVPDANMVKFSETKERIGEKPFVVNIDFTEGLKGTNYMLIEQNDAEKFAAMIIEKSFGMKMEEWGEMSEAALLEVFNIMVGSMSTTLTELFKRGVNIVPPRIIKGDIYEVNPYEVEERIVSIWFEVKVEDGLTLHLVQLLSADQAKDVVSNMKGDK